MTTYAVIMAGGSGTRFWPLSRRRTPKQLLPLWDGRSLLALTADRLSPLAPLDRLLVVAGGHLADPIRAALPELPEANLVIEPAARNTLPCIALAVALIRERDPEAVVGIFSADQLVSDDEAFLRACEVGVAAAREGRIATIGIAPDRPETGFGYIRYARDGRPARRVEAFVEKPDVATAEHYLAQGNYLWNAGIFFFTPATFDRELRRQRPLFAAAASEMQGAIRAGDEGAKAAAFMALEATSIDYGIMEGAEEVVVVPAEFAWNDVGNWGALDGVLSADEHGNIAIGETVLRETRDCVVISRGAPDKVVALIGLEGVVVVDTPEATLVLPKDQAQRVREVVAALRERGREDLL